MADEHSFPSLPPRNNNPFRSMESSQAKDNDTPQPTWTPAALFHKFQAPSLNHVHDFRQCFAFAINNNNNNNSDDNNNNNNSSDNNNTDDNLVDLTVPPTLSTSTTLWSSRFLCHTCHTWLFITSSAYRHVCPQHATHHYHSQVQPSSYQCCGCQDQVELTYHDPIIPAKVLVDLSSTRALTRTYLDTTQQTALKPTVHSTLTTFQKYVNDLLDNTRRNINTQNPHFMERIGLDEITTKLLTLIGFTYQEGYFIAPGQQVDNDRLYMIREELAASLLEIAATTGQQTTGVTESDCPIADPVVLNDLLGCLDTMEHGARSNSDNNNNNKTGLYAHCDVLGVTPLASDDLIVWAYRQMVLERPENLHVWLDALNDITNIKGGEILQTELAIERSKGFISTKDVDLAYQYFGAQQDIEDETLVAAHQYKTQDYPAQKSLHDEKLRIIGESRKTGYILRYLETGSISVPGTIEEDVYDYSRTRTQSNAPVGLTNIGNTCYLNSLLQYYYTLVPFRTTILNMEDFVENEDKIDWQSKKIGGIQVDQKEVKRAKKFVGLLQKLFLQLGQTTANEIAPEFDLAKMALLNEKEDDVIEKVGSSHVDVKDGSSMEESVSTLVDSKKESDDEGNINDSSTITTQHNELDFTQQESLDDSINNVTEQITTTATTTSTTSTTTPFPPQQPAPSSKRMTGDVNMMLGRQQDVTECMDNVMYLVEAALKPQETENMEQTRDMIRDLFYGKARQILSYKDTETTNEIQKVMEEDFSHVIVDAADGKNLYDGLDEYFFADKVENFQGGKEATREVTVRSFPPVLQIQVQRVQFDRATSQVYKSNAFVQFDKIIYLDRYLDSNFQALAPRREKVALWAKELAQCRENIKNLSVKVDSSAPGGGQVDLPVPWMFEKTAAILEGFEFNHPTPTPVDLLDAVQLLKQEAQTTRDFMKDNVDQANDYETKIRHEYDDLTECEYLLHAVFMHKGEANYGHYWLYILDHKTDCWWKFNDSIVTKVEESEILKNTTGTKSNPYFLVYIRKESIDSLAEVTRADA
ncbi:hypothetical protein BC941DRAFT_514209 [Chlamydoabsidia padenii]|nr:hypothetical protein BC941DRAFT_514209 [Chlamydoabsidia padenii]